jgi:hypothetical protein
MFYNNINFHKKSTFRQIKLITWEGFLTEEYHHWGLTINVSKTEYLVPNTDDGLYIEGHKIKKVNNFCYLGSILEQNGTSNLEINK